MGVSSTTNTVIAAGDGVTTTFPFAFYFFAQADLYVYLYDTTAGTISARKTLNTDYTITGTANAQGLYPNGGSVVYGSAPASGISLVISRFPAESQTFTLLQNGTIPSAALVQELDYLTLLVQSLQDQINRCIQIPPGFGATFSPFLPASTGLSASALAYLQINQNSNGVTLNTALPKFTKVTIPYTSLQTAATTVHSTLFALPAGAMLTSIIAKHSVAFAGTSITDVYLQFGQGTTYAQFASMFDVLAAVSDSNFAIMTPNFVGSWASTTNIVLTAKSVGANLSALTAGSVDIYYSYVILT